ELQRVANLREIHGVAVAPLSLPGGRAVGPALFPAAGPLGFADGDVVPLRLLPCLPRLPPHLAELLELLGKVGVVLVAGRLLPHGPCPLDIAVHRAAVDPLPLGDCFGTLTAQV